MSEGREGCPKCEGEGPEWNVVMNGLRPCPDCGYVPKGWEMVPTFSRLSGEGTADFSKYVWRPPATAEAGQALIWGWEMLHPSGGDEDE